MPNVGTAYRAPHKRRITKRTNYKLRLALVKSGKTRLVVRRSSKNISVQFVKFEPNGDKTLVSAVSQQLKKLGWEFGRGNLPAAYLTGLLAAKKAIKNGVKEATLDIGLQNSIRGSRLYAALKGVVDGGVNIPHSEEIFPSQERIEGKHIADWIKNDKLTGVFQDVKEKILKM